MKETPFAVASRCLDAVSETSIRDNPQIARVIKSWDGDQGKWVWRHAVRDGCYAEVVAIFKLEPFAVDIDNTTDVWIDFYAQARISSQAEKEKRVAAVHVGAEDLPINEEDLMADMIGALQSGMEFAEQWIEESGLPSNLDSPGI
ncbi:hypothetical protein [Streptomyces sp. NPDC048001]|uniref:hypothetical protein n=1 Tax=Streptomyces sp. NPDC048001 TaxID=3365498 RepID=UPI0037134538